MPQSIAVAGFLERTGPRHYLGLLICSVFAFVLYAAVWFWYLSVPVAFVAIFVKRQRKHR